MTNKRGTNQYRIIDNFIILEPEKAEQTRIDRTAYLKVKTCFNQIESILYYVLNGAKGNHTHTCIYERSMIFFVLVVSVLRDKVYARWLTFIKNDHRIECIHSDTDTECSIRFDDVKCRMLKHARSYAFGVQLLCCQKSLSGSVYLLFFICMHARGMYTVARKK